MGSTIGRPTARSSPSQRHGQRVHREVALGEIARQRRRAEVVEVELYAKPGHPRGAALGVEHDRGGADAGGDALGQGERPVGHGEVDVGAGPAEKRVAHGAAHEDHAATGPGRRPRRAQQRHRRRGQTLEAQLGAVTQLPSPKKRSALSWKILRRTVSSSPRSQAHRRSSS